ncbi:MAG: hypothetical protein AAB358_01390 [Patescibacteria group bacterium]
MGQAISTATCFGGFWGIFRGVFLGKNQKEDRYRSHSQTKKLIDTLLHDKFVSRQVDAFIFLRCKKASVDAAEATKIKEAFSALVQKLIKTLSRHRLSATDRKDALIFLRRIMSGVSALGAAQIEKAIILVATKDENPEMRQRACLALYDFFSPQIDLAFIACLTDPDERVVKIAENGLKTSMIYWEDEQLISATTTLKNMSWRLRKFAIEVLKDRRSQEVEAVLIRLLDDDDHDIRQTVSSTLEGILHSFWPREKLIYARDNGNPRLGRIAEIILDRKQPSYCLIV